MAMKRIHTTTKGFRIRLESRLKNAELVRAREKLGLSAKAVAEALGISYSLYCFYERMQRYPSEERQKKICEFFRKRGAFLYEEDAFPESLQQFKPHGKYIHEARIPEEKLLALSAVDERRLIAEKSGVEELVEREISDARERLLYEVLATLPQRYQQILKLRFGFEGEPKTYESIGKKLGIRGERTRQIERKALERLREQLIRMDAQECWRYLYERARVANDTYSDQAFQNAKLRHAFAKAARVSPPL